MKKLYKLKNYLHTFKSKRVLSVGINRSEKEIEIAVRAGKEKDSEGRQSVEFHTQSFSWGYKKLKELKEEK